MNKKIKAALIPIVERLQPAARIAERVAGLAVHVQKPTIMGITGLAATGLSALAEQLGQSKTPGCHVRLLMSKGQVVRAIEQTDAKVTVHKYNDGSEYVDCQIHGTKFTINQDGSISTVAELGNEFIEWLRQAIDRTLPAAIEVRQNMGGRGEGLSYEARSIPLSTYQNDQAMQILADTLPLIDGGRSILIDGRPGVGKTTIAEIIAREAGLGRTVKLDGPILGGAKEATMDNVASSHSSNELREAIHLLSPGVIIVDDIDKLYLSLSTIESLRAAARRLILTANNGEHDEVLDGATTRAGRVDEVFTIKPATIHREPIFDRLTDDEWEEVSQWPVAYLNEVRKRLARRPNELRLEDLRARLEKRTRSGDSLR